MLEIGCHASFLSYQIKTAVCQLVGQFYMNPTIGD